MTRLPIRSTLSSLNSRYLMLDQSRNTLQGIFLGCRSVRLVGSLLQALYQQDVGRPEDASENLKCYRFDTELPRAQAASFGISLPEP